VREKAKRFFFSDFDGWDTNEYIYKIGFSLKLFASQKSDSKVSQISDEN
jgi:hypothetical protein